MKRRDLLIGALLGAFLTVGAASAQESSDSHAIIGTWQLDVGASSYDPGPGPQGLRRIFAEDDEGFIVSGRITLTQSGNPSFAMVRLKFDGADYEVWTDGGLYTFLSEGTRPGAKAAFEVVDDHTLRLTQKNAAGEVGPLSPNMWVISQDGQTLTVTTEGTTNDGTAVRNVEVYRRVAQESGG